MSDSATVEHTVRAATADDAESIGTIQVDAWVAALGDRLGRRRHDAFDRAAVIEQWRSSIASPPSDGHRVYVAATGDKVCGFIAVAPPGDIVAWEVDPSRRRRGHGSRLLQAAAHHLRQTGGTIMRTWALENDRVRSEYLVAAGFALTGMRRDLEGPGIEIPEQLWHTSLETDEETPGPAKL